MNWYRVLDMAPRRPAEGVEIRVVPGERMTMAFFRLNQGAIIPEHAHPHEQIGTVLTGEIELTVAGETRSVAAGEAYQIPSGVVHSGRALAPCSDVMEVFSPPREDLVRA